MAITEMYPWIPWELIAYPWGSAEYTLGATVLTSILILLPHVCVTIPGCSFSSGLQAKILFASLVRVTFPTHLIRFVVIPFK